MDPGSFTAIVFGASGLIAWSKLILDWWQNRHKPQLEKRKADYEAVTEVLSGLRLDVQSLRIENRGLRTDLVEAQQGMEEYRKSDAVSLDLLRQAREELFAARTEIFELRWLLVTLCRAMSQGCDMDGAHTCPFTKALPPDVRKRIESFGESGPLPFAPMPRTMKQEPNSKKPREEKT